MSFKERLRLAESVWLDDGELDSCPDPCPSDEELADVGFDLDEILGSALGPSHRVPDDDGEPGPGPVPGEDRA